MNYKIIELKKKLITTTKPVKLTNSDPNLREKVGSVWEEFSKKVASIKNSINGKPICTYSNYENNEKGVYDIATGLEVNDVDDGQIKAVIPAGKYAKFVLKGKMPFIVSDFWQNLWNLNLPRKFSCDFEEYQNNDQENAEVHVFIALKDV